MKHQTTLALYSYWSRLRGNRTAPLRSEIEPADIRAILAETFILNADRGSDYSYRLAGSKVCAPYCREVKDRNFLSFWTGHDFEAVQNLLLAIRENGAAAVFGWQARNMRGQTALFETVLLPLETRKATIGRVLGSTAIIDAPYWIGTHPVMEQELTSLRLIWPKERAAGERFRAASDRSPPPAIAVDPASGAIARRFGHLLVYEGGKQRQSSDLGA